MNHIKLFESFNLNIEDILIEYIDEDHIKIFKNEFCEVCIFPQDSNMLESAKKRLSKFNIDFKYIDTPKVKGIITNLDNELINFLDVNLGKLHKIPNTGIDYYLKNLSDGFTKTYFTKNIGTFYIDGYILDKFKLKFNLFSTYDPYLQHSPTYDQTIKIITTWYVKEFLENDVVSTYAGYRLTDV